MMYDEYAAISGTDVNFDVYEKLIEPMYKAVPWLDKHTFISFLNTDALAKTAIKPAEYPEPWYDTKIEELQAYVDEQHTRIDELETQLRCDRAQKAYWEDRCHSACDLLIDIYSSYQKEG